MFASKPLITIIMKIPHSYLHKSEFQKGLQMFEEVHLPDSNNVALYLITEIMDANITLFNNPFKIIVMIFKTKITLNIL